MPRPELLEPTLLAAVCASPHDDAPRIVYADFLESQGAAHDAELIRRQVALCAADPYDAERLRVHAVERDWISGRRCERPRPALPASLEWPAFAFERGFLARIVARDVATLVEHGPRLVNETPLTAIELDLRELPSLEQLARAPWLRQIRSVRFFLGRPGAEQLAPFFESPYLTSLVDLQFEYEGVYASGVGALMSSAVARRLERVGLGNNFFVWSGAPLRDTFKAEGELPWRALSLLKNRIPPELLATLSQQVALPQLQELELSGNPIGADLFSAAAPWLGHGRLIRLGLAETQPGLEGVRSLAAAPQLAGLRSLTLDNNRLGPQGIKALAAAPWAHSLEVLSLGNNPLGDKGAELIAAAPAFERLVSLDLGSCKLGEAGLRALLDSPHLARLRVLDIFEQSLVITDKRLAERLFERFGRTVRVAET